MAASETTAETTETDDSGLPYVLWSPHPQSHVLYVDRETLVMAFRLAAFKVDDMGGAEVAERLMAAADLVAEPSKYREIRVNETPR